MPRRKPNDPVETEVVKQPGTLIAPVEYCQVTLEFVEPLLGMTPGDADTWEKWIKPAQQREAAKAHQDITAAQDEEGALIAKTATDAQAAWDRAKADAKAAKDPDFVADERPRQMTTFFRDEHGPLLWNYQILGHLKEIGNLAKEALGVTNLRHKIERSVFILPRRIYIEGVLTEPIRRPLRANTPQGQVVAIAESHAALPGARITFWIGLLPNHRGELSWDLLRALFDWGEIRGLGQWRTAGWGTYEVVEWTPTTNRPPLYVKPVRGAHPDVLRPLRWG